MADSAAIHLHIHNAEQLPDGYAEAICAIFGYFVNDLCEDDPPTELSGTAFVGTRTDIANDLNALMTGDGLPPHRFGYTIYEEPHHEALGRLLRYTPDYGDFEATCSNTGQVLLTFSDVARAIESTDDRESLVATLKVIFGEAPTIPRRSSLGPTKPDRTTSPCHRREHAAATARRTARRRGGTP
jgi:hypothetical protein